MTSIAIDLTDGLSSSTAIKGPCRVATTAEITLSGEQTIDGVAVVTGDRVLVKNQSTTSLNGIYVADTGTWRRAKDFSGNRDVRKGTRIIVTDGTGAGEYNVTSANPITIGTTGLTFNALLGGASLGPGVGTFLATPTSANLAAAVTGETGTGALVFATSPTMVTPILGAASATSLNLSGLTASSAVATDGSKNLVSVTNTGSGNNVLATSPTLVTPALGTPSAAVLTNATGLPISTGVSGLAASMAAFLAGGTSAQLAATLTDETGSGSLVFATSPVLVTPNLGTPSAATLTNATGLPIATGVSGLATGIAAFLATPSSANLRTALTDEVGTGAAYFVGGALGTPASGTLTNAIGLPVATGISGLGTSVAAFLATPSSANLAAALTDETGSGAAVFANGPTLVAPLLGTPASGVLTNATGLPISTGVAGLAANMAAWLAGGTSAQLIAAVTDETGTGSLVFATSCTLVTPILGVATATSINKVAITAPATSATLTLVDGTTLTGPAASGTAMTLGNVETVTGAKTFGSAGAVGKLKVAGTTSGSTILDATAVASGTLTLPAATDTLVGKATTDVLTNKTFDTAGAGNSFSINGVAASANTGTGAVVRASNPVLTAPSLDATAIWYFSGSDPLLQFDGGDYIYYNRTTNVMRHVIGNTDIGVWSTSGLTVSLALSRNAPVTKTADFTIGAAENWLINNKAAATCTVTFPAASAFSGREIMIKNLQAFTVVSASSNVVPLAGGAAGTAILAAAAGKWATLVSDGTSWIIMAAA